MKPKTTSTDDTPSSPAPTGKAEQTAGTKMTHAEYMEKLSKDPAFKIIKPSGKGFVIGGVRPRDADR